MAFRFEIFLIYPLCDTVGNNTDNVLVLFYFLTKEVTPLIGTKIKTKLYTLGINEGDMSNYLNILLFTFVFTLAVFVSKPD